MRISPIHYLPHIQQLLPEKANKIILAKIVGLALESLAFGDWGITPARRTDFFIGLQHF